MKFIEQHIVQVEKIFEQYRGQEPLHLFLKKYFKKQSKFGSRDRRNIAEYLYGVYRMGRENRHLSVRERVYFYLYLKGEQSVDFFAERFPELAATAACSFDKKIAFLRTTFELRETFRTQDQLSEKIDDEVYRNSYYREPKVFVRLRNNTKDKYARTIERLGGETISEDCVAFGQRVKLDENFTEQDVVVQDYNSQRTIELSPLLKKGTTVWDTCAGSGGKSILLLDRYPDAVLTATDVRASILRNLIHRFEVYKLEAEVIAEMNVNKKNDLAVLDGYSYDFILCDVPCTGSGTWARTPEQFYFFEKKQIEVFHKRQLDILTNASTKLNNGGALLYITCSVYKRENEDVLNQFLAANPDFVLEEQQYLDGTQLQADTLFAARLSKK